MINFNAEPTALIDFAQLEGKDSVKVFNPVVEVQRLATRSAGSASASTEVPEVSYRVSFREATDALMVQPAKSYEANAKGEMAVADLRAAVESIFGKAPKPRELYANVELYATIDGTTYRYSDLTEVAAKLVAPQIDEKGYYLVGSINGWNYAGAVKYKFQHSGKDVYDDPVFTLTIPAPTKEDGTRDDLYYKIVPAAAMNAENSTINFDLVLGSDQDTEAAREVETLKVGGAKALKQVATDGAKFYNISLNMMDYKATVTALSFDEYIYVPGNHQGWSPATAPALWSEKFDGVYKGFSQLNGDFKFTKVRDWKGEYNYNDFVTLPETFKKGDGSNLNAPAGLYFLTANAATKSLAATPITRVALIGNFNGWPNDATDLAMTYVPAEDCYQVDVTLDGKEFKVRFNGEWKDGLDLGGQLDNLSMGGGNLTAPAGTYTAKLYLSRAKSTKLYLTLTPKS